MHVPRFVDPGRQFDPSNDPRTVRRRERIEDPVKMYTGDHLTVIASLCGIPALSLPCGRTSERLPIGLQIVGRHQDDFGVLQLARAFEKYTQFWKQRPAVVESV